MSSGSLTGSGGAAGVAGGSTKTATASVYEQQREELVREIALGMENVLQNINRLNRNLESIIAVGNEFSSVEALWSQFENFMGPQDHERENHNNHNNNSHGHTRDEDGDGDGDGKGRENDGHHEAGEAGEEGNTQVEEDNEHHP